jgi:hypothetical protein
MQNMSVIQKYIKNRNFIVPSQGCWSAYLTSICSSKYGTKPKHRNSYVPDTRAAVFMTVMEKLMY